MTTSRFSDIGENLKGIRHNIEEAAAAANRDPAAVTMMAVTKTVSAEDVNAAIRQGVTVLGENRAQELLGKYDAYERENCEIHFIGHLQSNKVRQIINKVSMIQSVDSLKLASEIGRQAVAAGGVLDVLIEVNIGGEASKSGVLPAAVPDFAMEIDGLEGLRLRGLMTIPPICDKIEESERYFERARKLFVDMKDKNRDNRAIDILSMGMSGDYPAAIRQGATLIRLGTALFGARHYI
ncbi:MAG: YggS family pyridoxal phosphate-dependent enzyme [Oscillospiraceae bacterium]|jgi:pyridoxal phosphate enzyme (YggS family)|nr:YggS family pyridoxal phosphate-dependent enzyme [Oscillospiraceae bacterium]